MAKKGVLLSQNRRSFLGFQLRLKFVCDIWANCMKARRKLHEIERFQFQSLILSLFSTFTVF